MYERFSNGKNCVLYFTKHCTMLSTHNRFDVRSTGFHLRKSKLMSHFDEAMTTINWITLIRTPQSQAPSTKPKRHTCIYCLYLLFGRKTFYSQLSSPKMAERIGTLLITLWMRLKSKIRVREKRCIIERYELKIKWDTFLVIPFHLIKDCCNLPSFCFLDNRHHISYAINLRWIIFQ